MIIKVKVEDNEFVIDTDKEVKIDEADLVRGIAEQPSKYAWLATTLAVYESQEDRIDELLQDKEHALYEMYKNAAEAKGEKVTERLLTAKIRANTEFQLVLNEHLVVKEAVRKLKAVVGALNHRKDMLIELSRIKRGEMALDNMNM